MRMFRFVTAVVLLLALAAASVHPTSTSARASLAVPCDATSLGGAFAGSMQLDSIDRFGCQGTWAYAWATIGVEPHKFGVTEVLAFHVATSRWAFASRASVCTPGGLPPLVYRLGCFSN